MLRYAALVLLLPVAGLAADPVGAGPAWKLDEIVLKNGGTARGLILQETDQGIRFQVVRRLPGRPTVTLTTSYLTREVLTVRRLSDADRAALREKVAELDQTGEGEL